MSIQPSFAARTGVMSPPAPYRRATVAAALVLGRLRALSPLDRTAEVLIAGLTELQSVKSGAELVAEREPHPRARFVVAGWGARVRWLPDGRRQIFNFVLPGDSVGLFLRPSPAALSATIALTPMETLDATAVQRAVLGEDPAWATLREAIHAAAGLEEAQLLSQILRLGRQTAYERISHLLLELRDRLDAAHLAEEASYPMPLTQEVLADATGLSVVHVNRILQQLRRERLVDIHGGRVRLLDRAALALNADYTPTIPAPRPSLRAT
jgi:CRP-like cAMP-binding protein